MEIIEQKEKWRGRFERWQEEEGGMVYRQGDDGMSNYPLIENKRVPFAPHRGALPMMNLALVTSAGAYIDGTEAFDTQAAGGDVTFREIPTEIEATDLLFAARGYDPAAVRSDLNAQIPIERLYEFAGNGIIGNLNSVFFSFCGFIPDAPRLAEDSLPRFVERVKRYEVGAVLLIPASRLCHQSMALAARSLEAANITTMMLAVDRAVVDSVRAPRAVYHRGQFGRVAGEPMWPEHQRRVLDEALRTMEPMDQPGTRGLVVDLETSVEVSRGEK